MTLTICSIVVVLAYCWWDEAIRQESRQQLDKWNSFRQIAAALRNYRSDHQVAPPPFIADHEGRPMHSWRVLVLPYLGRQKLYDQYDFSQPWNGPTNRLLAARVPDEYRTADPERIERGITQCVAITGDDSIWQTDRYPLNEEIEDADKTVVIVEAPQLNINWLDPRDLPIGELGRCFDGPTGQDQRRYSVPSTMVGLANGDAKALSANLDPAIAKALVAVHKVRRITDEQMRGGSLRPRYPFYGLDAVACLLALVPIYSWVRRYRWQSITELRLRASDETSKEEMNEP